MPRHSLHRFLRRWAAALALLAVVAQGLAQQASVGHLAAMLSANWLASDICTGSLPGAGGRLPLALDFGDENAEDDTGPVLAQCPLCAVAVLPLLQPQRLAAAPLAPPAARAGPLLAAPVLPLARPRYLLPPAHGPPVAA